MKEGQEMRLYTSYGFLFAKAHQRLQDLIQPDLEKEGLNTKQMGLLFVIQEKPGITQKEAGALQKIDRTTMTQSIDTLEGLGLVSRELCVADRRAHALHLTEKGEKTTDCLWSKLYEVQSSLFSKLSSEDLSKLKEYLMIISKG